MEEMAWSKQRENVRVNGADGPSALLLWSVA
jgi:hypothetical protein